MVLVLRDKRPNCRSFMARRLDSSNSPNTSGLTSGTRMSTVFRCRLRRPSRRLLLATTTTDYSVAPKTRRKGRRWTSDLSGNEDQNRQDPTREWSERLYYPSSQIRSCETASMVFSRQTKFVYASLLSSPPASPVWYTGDEVPLWLGKLMRPRSYPNRSDFEESLGDGVCDRTPSAS